MKKIDTLPSFRKKKSKKRLLRGLLYISPVLALFCLVTSLYIVSYYDRSQREEEPTPGTIIHAGQWTEEVEKQQIVAADDNTDIYITPRMTYTLETYDARTNQLAHEIRPIPTDMYGLNRTELEQYLMELARQENHFDTQVTRHYQVTVFSRREFTVRMTITENSPEYAVFLIAENGWLIAYTGDRTAVYEELEIALGDFPLEQQAMLTQGVYMKSLSDYYDFLETYSS